MKIGAEEVSSKRIESEKELFVSSNLFVKVHNRHLRYPGYFSNLHKAENTDYDDSRRSPAAQEAMSET